jgi:hypothetical protein
MYSPKHFSRHDTRRAFLRHLATFAWVLGLLALIDLALTGTDDIWVQWVAVIWGAILGVHFLDAFVFDGFLGFHGACWGGRNAATDSADQQERTA